MSSQSESSSSREPLWGNEVEETCSCLVIDSVDAGLAEMLMLEKYCPSHESIDCIIDNISRVFNLIFNTEKDSVSPRKVAFADIFFRIRHEILFKAMCLSLNLPTDHSDRPFRDFGVDSKRTPDYISEVNGIVVIIEVTATSGFEKAAQMKGMEQMGFESKYKVEIDMFRDKGVSCKYLPLFFDMSDMVNPINNEQMSELGEVFKINKGYKILLNKVAVSFSVMTTMIKNELRVSSAILFTKEIPAVFKHNSHEFLYKRVKDPVRQQMYKQLTISLAVYNKVSNNVERIIRMLTYSKYPEGDRVVILVNSSSYTLSLERNAYGRTAIDLLKIISDGNKFELFKCVKLKVGNVIIDSINSETGVKIYERVNNDSKATGNFTEVRMSVNHNPIKPCRGGAVDMKFYETLVNSYLNMNLQSVHYDPCYEDKILEVIKKCDDVGFDNTTLFSKKLLGNMETNKIHMRGVIDDLIGGYKDQNRPNEGLPMVKLKMKSPFILPIVSVSAVNYCKLDFKNTSFINGFVKKLNEDNEYTRLIMLNVLDPGYLMYSEAKPPSSSYNDLLKRRAGISNRINQLQKELIKKSEKLQLNTFKLSRVNDDYFKPAYMELKKEFNSVRALINKRQKEEDIKKEISLIRIPTKNKGGEMNRAYASEMSHFKNKKVQSTIEGVGIRTDLDTDYENDVRTFNDINSLLCEYRGVNMDPLYDSKVAEDCMLLQELKAKSMENFEQLKTQITDSSLGHSAAFISRLAHSLMFYSQLPFNSDYIRVDNLGYNNVLLIVKGGKKIFKTKASKAFRILAPIDDCMIPWYKHGHINGGSTEIIELEGLNYILTPWSMLHESILTDCISFYPRVCSFALLNLNPKIDLRMQYHKVAMNILLAFHNRRQTEVLLANLRYILLSTMGDFTGTEQIMKEFLGFNYDCFQAFIRACIIKNYPDYFDCLEGVKESKKEGKLMDTTDLTKSGIKNIFTGERITEVEDMALMIYSTFLMTKAPYQKVAERARNLRGILEIHDYYTSSIGKGLTPQDQLDKISVTCADDLETYVDKIFSNDFNMDPKFCALVGNFTNSVLIEQGDSDEITSAWVRILNETWDELATSTGLRGDYDKIDDFWGQKGYFVVYKTLLNDCKYVSNLQSLFSMDLSDDGKRKLLRQMNRVYSEELDPEREFLIFHAVDKVQWRGGREIYVMDMLTKTLQQPIEKFLGFLCSKLDNELISIPSDRRAQVIHHSIFEKDLPLRESLTWYLTLDCTKWAPKSVFVKFAIMFLNMSVLPNSFKIHFLNYIEKLYKKRIYFNTAEVEALRSNVQYKDAIDSNLIEDKKVGGFYLEMPYSWVMGIFNYTSSFMHAANQKYFSYILVKSSMLNLKEDTAMVMFAHSDDSGGRLTTQSFVSAKRAIILYEVFLKSCNHLLSRKKSVISRIYFEILSVIYIFNKLLALLPKFLGGLRFLPTDKGACQDISQSYSKCIEVMVSGATFDTAYLVMKIVSMMVWRFYFKKPPNPSDYNRPVQYLGMPDAHPLMVLLCGSDSDILRLLMSDKARLDSLIAFVNKFISTIDDCGPIKPFKFEVKVRGVERGFEEFIDMFAPELEKWSISNVNYHSTPMNTLSFLKKLNDPGFVGSLVNESIVRRISRCYHMGIGDSVITKVGSMKLRTVLDSLRIFDKCHAGEGDDYSSLKTVVEGIVDEETALEVMSFGVGCNVGNSLSIKLLEKTLESPINICTYLNQISLKDRKITQTNRTLKPTQVQLVKTSRVFSTAFDPASLVSYLKEPELRWALKDVRNVVTSSEEVVAFIEGMGVRVDDILPENLLKICRVYGRENVKNIYLYSRVPSEIRNIKTYSAFLTFISVNSFPGKEIGGLTLKIDQKDSAKEYLSCNVDDSVYYINSVINLIQTLLNKCGAEFTMCLTIREVKDIGWEGGSVSDLLKFIENSPKMDYHKGFIDLPLKYLLNKLGLIQVRPDSIKNSAFYTFLKSQKVRSGWYGDGELYISLEGYFYSFLIVNTKTTSCYTNRVGRVPQHHSDFINDVFNVTGVSYKSIFENRSVGGLNDSFLGLDLTGCLSVLGPREVRYGIRANKIDRRRSFLDNLPHTRFAGITETGVLIKDMIDEGKTHKLYFLPVRKTDMVPIIRMCLSPEDFSAKVEEEGLNDFEDFIMTEILVEYGKENHIDFDEFLDNFQGSKTYEVIKKVSDTGCSKVTRRIKTSNLPACEGSLTRIFIDYTAETGDKVINILSNIDSDMMKIRSEYPEEMSVILAEKMVDSFHKMYNNVEIAEISEAYSSLCNAGSRDEMRREIIKLMTFWGYGSLVNSVQTFALSKDVRNYEFFNLSLLDTPHSRYFDTVYEWLVKSINLKIKDWASLWPSLETPVGLIKSQTSITEVCSSYVLTTVMGVYGHQTTELRFDLYNAQYINCLMGFLTIEEFCADLQIELSKNYILSSIPVNYKERVNLILMLNTLRCIWQGNNRNNYRLDFNQQVERVPHDVPNYRSLMKAFGETLPVQDVYYHAAVRREMLSFILSKVSVPVEDYIVEVTPAIKKLSKVPLPLNGFKKFERPLKSTVFEDENWEELEAELSFDGYDEDYAEELWEGFGDVYVEKKTRQVFRKSGKVILADIDWLILPFMSSTSDITKFIRQSGENICVYTNTYLHQVVANLPNSGCRMVNYTKVIKSSVRPIFVIYTLSDEVYSEKFLDRYIGGVEMSNIKMISEILHTNKIRNIDSKVCGTASAGLFIGQDEMLGVVLLEQVDDRVEPVTAPVRDVLEEKHMAILSALGNLEGKLSPETLKSMKRKYMTKALKHGLSKEIIIKSLMNESEITMVLEGVIAGTVGLTANERIKAFSTPTFFNLSNRSSKISGRPIKDKKIRTELKSVHHELPAGLGSGTLKISNEFLKVLSANHKIWTALVKGSEYKKHNKTFLLTLVTGCVNSAIVSEDSSQDHIWQEVINKSVIYLSSTSPDDEEDEDSLFGMFGIKPGSRLRYRPEGM